MDHPDIWPGCDVRFIECGHISAYVLHQKLFKKTIAEAVDRYREKYHPDGRLKEGPPSPILEMETTAKAKVIDVLGFQKAKATTDSSQRV